MRPRHLSSSLGWVPSLQPGRQYEMSSAVSEGVPPSKRTMHFDIASNPLQKTCPGRHCARQIPPLAPSPPMSFESDVMHSRPLRQVAALVHAAPSLPEFGPVSGNAPEPHSHAP